MKPVFQWNGPGGNADSAPINGTLVAHRPIQGPRLLVSVRSVDEAVCALAGGAEILDVKEPSGGSLGMAAIDDISKIATLEPMTSQRILLSVALDEVAAWHPSSTYPALPSGITFAKLGLSQCALNSNWRADWLNVRAEFERRSSSNLSWVAVAYADSIEARSPGIAEVLTAAIDTGCAGLLIDTWTKDGRTLLEGIDEASMTGIANDCHAAGLFLAVAGKLNRQSLTRLAGVPVDVVAIRSAACVGTDRTAQLDSRRVADFQKELRRCFDPSFHS